MKTICPLDCPDSCGMIANVTDGKVISLTGDRSHPYTNGFICRKMRSYPERVYSQKRILYPLRRVGKKGAAEFSRISWDEVFDICAQKLAQVKDEFGGEAILPYAYAGNMGLINRFSGFPLFHKLGASRLAQTICSAASGAGWKKQCGDLPGTPPENAAEAELIIAWGINIKVTNVHFWQYVSRARKNGAKLLVIDPYRNHTAKSSDLFLQVSPGGDSALALGLLKLLIEKKQVDREFIAAHTVGFEEIAEYLSAVPVAEFVGQSGISEKEMAGLFDLLGTHKKTFIRIGNGLSRNSRGAMSIRAITALAAGLGLFGGGSGRGILLSTGAFKGDNDILTRPELLPYESRTINMIHLGQALTTLSPPVKALVVYNANPLSANPDAGSVRKGLAREDLFTVVHEQVMTPTAQLADLVLPATTFLENHDLYTSYGHFHLGVSEPVIEPVGEAKSNFDFFQELARRMGFKDADFKQTCTGRIEKYLETVRGIPSDLAIAEIMAGRLVTSTNVYPNGDALLKKKMRYRFVVNDNCVEPPLPCLIREGEFKDPDLASRFPLKLITPPHPGLLNSTFGERFEGQCGEVLIHPEDAKKYGVDEGGEVLLKNHRGSVRRLAKLTTDTRRGLVVAEGIFWPTPTGVGEKTGDGLDAGINSLTSQKTTDMGEGATFHESLITLESLNFRT